MHNTQALQDMQTRFKSAFRMLPDIVGAEVVNFSKDRFTAQNWRGNTLVPWKQRAAGAKRNTGRAILIWSGRLRRSIRVTQKTSEMVAVGTDVPYARAHNQGFKGVVQVKAHDRNRYGKQQVGTGKFTSKGKERMKTVQTIKGSVQVKAHTKKMNIPQRQYLGNSPWLTKKLTVVVTKHIMKALTP